MNIIAAQDMQTTVTCTHPNVMWYNRKYLIQLRTQLSHDKICCDSRISLELLVVFFYCCCCCWHITYRKMWDFAFCLLRTFHVRLDRNSGEGIPLHIHNNTEHYNSQSNFLFSGNNLCGILVASRSFVLYILFAFFFFFFLFLICFAKNWCHSVQRSTI